MRAVIQRVARARVVIGKDSVGSVGKGVLVLVGVSPRDGDDEVRWLADKVANLRIFSDEAGRMNRSLLEIEGAALVVSQFTLYGDARKGRRPSFVHAAAGPDAERLYQDVASGLESLGVNTATGEFGADMQVELINDGPVTILLDSDKMF
ncbi:MAG: D-tyrosyl-tRNA(Tyr) deacylase [Actinobacteria bacterium]|jgi:D-tyrosyl-tRNA(Tyr) deacylase|nr:D-tyrosyl-tRNA(Tyr) deacylase [Actinomycetota bacterium]MDQ3530877.1 D-aminoacyl-tRNA deacylase [Actinomycetota bacterium]